MALDKAIEHNKEHRKPYRGAKSVDIGCRNHGGGKSNECPWCARNRQYQNIKRMAQARELEKED